MAPQYLVAQPQFVSPPASAPAATYQVVPPPTYVPTVPPPATGGHGTKRKWDEAQTGSIPNLQQFQAQWDLDGPCIAFLSTMPPEVLQDVITNFTHAPHQTNASARCMSFAKARMAQWGLGGQAAAPPPVSPLQQFQATWGVDDRCMEYISSLHPEIQSQVLEGFRHTPDQTNVSGRCFAFARSIAQRVMSPGQHQQYQQQQQQLHQPPQRAVESWQDPWKQTGSWETEQWKVRPPPPRQVVPPPSRLLAVRHPPDAVAMPSYGMDAGVGGVSDDVSPLLEFQQRWGLDDKCIEFVASLPVDIQAMVIEKFDHRPDQTNASARCFSFAKSIIQRHGGGEAIQAPPQLSMLDQFQMRWGIDDRCKEYLASLSPSLQAHICQNFSHAPDQTNVSARCFAFAKGAATKLGSGGLPHMMGNGWA